MARGGSQYFKCRRFTKREWIAIKTAISPRTFANCHFQFLGDHHPTTMNLQNFPASTFALPMALCLMAQPLLADPSTVARPVPEIDVQQPAKNSLEDGHTKVSFGKVDFGKSGSAKKFTIRNLGNAPLTGLTVTRGGANPREFKLVQPAKTSLAAGKSTSFTVTFKPLIKGLRSAAIHIKSNDADEGSFDVILTGRGQ
jgi:hypothetical protein